MSDRGLSEPLESLISQHMTSMDHVALLLTLREQPDGTHRPAEVAGQTRLEPSVVERVLRDLTSSHLVRREGDAYRYAPTAAARGAVDEMALMYRTKPVTLVRAVYDRPARAVQSFADAFRLRKSGD